MITAGIDIGARNIKVVILKDSKVLSKNMDLCGFEIKASAEQVFQKALKDTGITEKDIKHIIATGAGVDMAPYATGKISMVGAIARAGVFLFPSARTVIDVGAEDARAAKCDEKGNLLDFVVNDRCAAGAGAFIEAMTRALELKLEEMGPLSLKSEKAIPMNAQCVIFGESEVVTLIHSQTSKADIARAVYDAMADRVSSMVRRLGVNQDVVLMGGVARDIGFIDSLKRKLGVDLLIPEYPDFAGALGAALSGL